MSQQKSITDDEINVENQFVTKNANLGAPRKAVFTYQHKPETYK